jgi:hypothetical protein
MLGLDWRSETSFHTGAVARRWGFHGCIEALWFHGCTIEDISIQVESKISGFDG